LIDIENMDCFLTFSALHLLKKASDIEALR